MNIPRYKLFYRGKSSSTKVQTGLAANLEQTHIERVDCCRLLLYTISPRQMQTNQRFGGNRISLTRKRVSMMTSIQQDNPTPSDDDSQFWLRKMQEYLHLFVGRDGELQAPKCSRAQCFVSVRELYVLNALRAGRMAYAGLLNSAINRDDLRVIVRADRAGLTGMP